MPDDLRPGVVVQVGAGLLVAVDPLVMPGRVERAGSSSGKIFSLAHRVGWHQC